MDKRAIILCRVEGQPIAAAIAEQYGAGVPFGPGGRRVSTDPTATVEHPTHLMVSGAQSEEFVTAMRISTVPFFMVIDNPDDLYPWPILAQLQPPLYPCVDTQEV